MFACILCTEACWNYSQIRFTRFTEKGLQSRSATASLLIKEEKTKLVFVLA
jgi:hypothetical protein